MLYGWMDDLRFYVLFNSISVISGRYLDDNERLCAMELRLRVILDLGSYAQGQGRNQVKDQNLVSAITQKLLKQI